MSARVDHFSLGSQHLAYPNYGVHPISPTIRRRSHQARRAQVRFISHWNCSDHTNTTVRGARSSRKRKVASCLKPWQIPSRNEDMERQEGVVKEHQPRRHGANSSSLQAGQATILVVWAFHSGEHGQARSFQAAERRRCRDKPHMEHRQSASLLPITSSPSKGCNFSFLPFL